jgi:ferredoxin
MGLDRFRKRAVERDDQAKWEQFLKWMRLIPWGFRLSHVPLLGKLLTRNTFIGDDSARNWIIPSQAVTIQVNESVETPANMHLPQEILTPLFEKASYRFQLKRCACRDAFGCKSYPIEIGCVFLGEAARKIPKGFGKEVRPAEAIAQADRALKLGLVPTIIWDNDIEDFGGRRDQVLVVCFCCDCCCDVRLGLRIGTRAFRRRVLRPPGVRVQVEDACDLCGACTDPETCSVSAIRLGPEKAEIDLQACVGCGRCVTACPNDAISFQLDPEVNVVESLLAQIQERTDIVSGSASG